MQVVAGPVLLVERAVRRDCLESKLVEAAQHLEAAATSKNLASEEAVAAVAYPQQLPLVRAVVRRHRAQH